MSKRYFGFTLIELLIVVAIIGILAAIAIPNFLQAQVRAKVSRVQSDLRSVATALESYRVDYGAYPAADQYALHTWHYCNYLRVNDGAGNDTGTFALTTPIDYLSSIPWDPFIQKGRLNPSSPRYLTSYVYTNFEAMWQESSFFNYPQGTGYGSSPSIHLDYYGGGPTRSAWLLLSQGPDGVSNWPQIPFAGCLGLQAMVDRTSPLFFNYDPTNGTISTGDIFRTQ